MLVSLSANADSFTPVEVSLISESTSIRPGGSLWVGLYQHIEPGWHTYWRNPGDSGQATAISWEVPEGFKVDEISWPGPQRITYGTMTNYGYETEVLLPVRITVPSDLPIGESFIIRADVRRLECKDVCIPREQPGQSA
jgi:DsbC/DsbD-like thiol-disulfide interchange protein